MRSIAERAHEEVVKLAHQGLDLIAFLQKAEEQLQRVLAYEGAACFFTIDPGTLLLTGHVNRDLDQDDERRRTVNLGVANNEYRQDDYNKFASLARGPSSAASLAEVTEGRPELSARYHSLIRPFGLEDEMRAAFVADGACWGGVALFRTSEQPSFDQASRRFVEGISGQVAEGIRTSLILGYARRDMGQQTPGLILVDNEGRVEALNSSATRWLEEFIDPGTPGLNLLPEVIHAVAEQARAASSGIHDHRPVRHRVPTRSGGWVVLHGTAFRGRREGVAIIIEPPRSPEIAPLLLEAHGLSDREQEVTFCVLQGLSTSEIARRLFISAYTVQDHLKAVFDKMGVHSRKALVAQVFFDHYFPGIQEQDPVTSTQWLGFAAERGAPVGPPTGSTSLQHKEQ